jgi:hypothetical protein
VEQSESHQNGFIEIDEEMNEDIKRQTYIFTQGFPRRMKSESKESKSITKIFYGLTRLGYSSFTQCGGGKL